MVECFKKRPAHFGLTFFGDAEFGIYSRTFKNASVASLIRMLMSKGLLITKTRMSKGRRLM